MELIRILVFLLMFTLFTSLSYLLLLKYLGSHSIQKRLNHIRADIAVEMEPMQTRLELQARKILSKLIHFSMPDEEWENSDIRARFMTAGYYRELDALIFFGFKTIFTLAVPILYVIVALIIHTGSSLINTLAIAVMLSGLGYYIPDLWLSRVSKARRQQIFESLPNALDLMRVCVNAGLGLDASIERVGKELQIESKALAQEFRILNLELRTGATREKALTNLAERTGVEDIHALVAMLIQTEHFGTSVAEALRVYSEGLREKRALLAQEEAAKIPVKMTIPLILCIFPALMVVLLGPAIITISKSLAPLFSGAR
jgi:tight adherence protein C